MDSFEDGVGNSDSGRRAIWEHALGHDSKSNLKLMSIEEASNHDEID
jgi:hypothetical protein